MGRFLELSRKRIAIRAGRSTHDLSIMAAIHIPDAVLLGLIVGHRPLDGEHTRVLIGDDEEEGRGWFRFWHGSLYHICSQPGGTLGGWIVN